MTCKHEAIGLFYDIERLSEVEGGPIKAFALSGNAICQACGQEFRAFRVKLTRPPIVVKNLVGIGKVTCEHMNFVKSANIDGGQIVSAAVACYDCGMKFDPVRFQLEPISKDAGLVLPSDEELEEIGKSIH